MTEQGLHNISLEDLCRHQGQPYSQLSPGDSNLVRELRSLTGTVSLPYRSSAMYCGRVQNVVVFGKSYVTDQAWRGVFFRQSHRDYFPDEFVQFYKTDIVEEVRTRPVIEPECCFIGGRAPFGHFIFEYLSRISAFSKMGLFDRLPIVVYDDVPDAWLDFLKLYGVPATNIMRIPRHPAPYFKSVWLTACPHALAQKKEYTFWDDGIADLRTKLRANAARLLPDKKGPERLYLGRKAAAHRRVVNEDQVWECLASRGFVQLDLSGVSAAEQVQAIASAELIVSVVGSGSPMTMCAPDTSSIIEIRPKSIVGALGSLGHAAVIGQTFTSLIAEVDTGDTENQGIDQNLIVNVDKLQTAVDMAIKQLELATRVAQHSVALASKN